MKQLTDTTRAAGFTLMELMIALAILGILAAIAYPGYQSQVQSSRRTDAQASLVAFANAMERHYTNNGGYTGAAGTDGTPANTGAPRIFATESPLDGGTKFYNLRINAATGTTYTLHAIPKGGQVDDMCGTLTLNQAGAKGITGADSGVTASDCWR